MVQTNIFYTYKKKKGCFRIWLTEFHHYLELQKYISSTKETEEELVENEVR